MRIIKCAHCGNEFESSAPNEKYCSPQCKIDGYKAMRKQWETRRPDYNRTYYLQRKGRKE